MRSITAHTDVMLGRASESDRCRRVLRSGGSVMLYGPAGIGKSTMLEVLAAQASETGELILRTAPGEAERQLTHLALLDLNLAPVRHLREDPLTLRFTVVETLRTLAAQQPVLLVIDNVQWMDAASVQVLAFAARRLSGTMVRVLAAQTVHEGDEPSGVRLCPVPVESFLLPPLTHDTVKELICDRAPHLSSSTLDRLATQSDGNPWYAVELAREGGLSERLRCHLRQHVRRLSEQALAVALMVAAAENPGRELFAPHDAGLEQALAARVLVAEPGGGLRFSQTLAAQLVYADASAGDRRDAHARLSTLLEDPIERIRHRALAAEQVDALLGDELSQAAVTAERRGSPGTAATLSRLAAVHTIDPSQAARRLLESATHATAAGLPDDARATCEAVLRRCDPAARVGARLLLAELSNADPRQMREHLTAAEADAGDDPMLLCRVRLMVADVTIREAGISGAAEEIAEAERLARLAGDDDLLLQALVLRVPQELQQDTGDPLPALDEAIELADGKPITDASVWVRQGHAVVLLRRGQTQAAMSAIRRLRSEVERAGRTRDLCRVLYTFCAIHERAGHCRQAAEAARTCGPMWTEVGLAPAAGLTMRGIAELNTGTAQQAAHLLAEAVECGESTSDPEWTAYAHVMLGRAQLMSASHTEAARNLRRGRELLHGLGYRDPAMILIEADLAEALAFTGDFSAAREVIAEGLRAARRQQREVVMLGLKRAEALTEGLLDDPRTAAGMLRETMPAAHPYPLELARCSLTLATLEKRARRRAAARLALERARAQFTAAGCVPWAHHAQQQLGRLDAIDSQASHLDLRLMEFVLDGLSNRAIASCMHLSVKAVEANLTRLYRRYGVSGRAELRGHLATR